MAERNFKEELDRLIERFERDSATLDEVWDAFSARADQHFDVSEHELVELEETCSAKPARPAPRFVSAVRC